MAVATSVEPAAAPTPAPVASRQVVAREVAVYAAAILTALVLIAILLLLAGANPLVAYGTILRSSLGSPGGFGQSLNKATPLALGALAVAFAMRGGFLNVGVDGQIYLGAICATGLAFLLGSG